MKYVSLPLALCGFFFSASALANNINYSSSLTGPLGLNTVPNARMDEEGTVSAGISTLDPYLHTYLGFQIAEPLFIGVRQTAEVSNLNEDADRLYPGVDLKLRILEETKYRPEIALGLQSALGHKRMAGEYLALSKRYKNFDFTAGIGWGRYGTAAHFENPLKAISNHFGRARELDGEIPNTAHDWFTGENIGIFGGIEYFTPIDGLSIKADYGADRYIAESAAFNFDAPEPWSIGLNYASTDWLDAGIALQGTDKVMARINLSGTPSKWPFTASEKEDISPLLPARSSLKSGERMKLDARNDGALLYALTTDEKTTKASLDLSPDSSTPSQIKTAAINISNNAGTDIETIMLRPSVYNLKGPRISLNRRDLERTLAHRQGSSVEIWNNAEFDTGGISNDKTSPFTLIQFKRQHYKFILDNQMSVAEEDNGLLYRTALLANAEGPTFFGLLHSGGALRLNIKDNLERLNKIRPRAILPVRSDVEQFANKTFSIENTYLTYTHSFTPNWHMQITGGLLEEMYGGLGGEILYRPFGKRYAFGAELWNANKRDPDSFLAADYTGDGLLTGHLNGWYDFAERDLTLKASVGRYLADDFGGTLSLVKGFDNGAKLEGFVTVTNKADFDLFGGLTHAHHGIRLSLPLGSIKHIPDGSEIRVSAIPFGRDIGQSINAPIKLYDATEPLSYDHIARHWRDITK